jgi:Holliday junction resolvase RusA-like endonuclease
MTYILNEEGQPAPRPRKGKFGLYTPSKYRNYLNTLESKIKERQVIVKDYSELVVRFYFKYPKSTNKKDLIDNFPHRKKFDCDNLVKGLMDALVYAGVLSDDSILNTVCVSKFYTLGDSRIEFELLPNN